ncbi:MAG: type II toxin-antitoxin system Phd/YefM family antitoxin [Chloroflexota bacterium]|nr:type II toxin-antitoxin system Phd/YefM family antitoxin [Chloroflexota bacterium]
MADQHEGSYEGREREPTRTWQVQEAKARFSELLETSLREGPQVVTRRGVETAVIVPIEEWRRLRKPKYANIKEWLLAPEARTEELVPPRLEWKLRPPPSFD